MWHRISRDDFVRTTELRRQPATGTNSWKVCQGYEVQETSEIARDDYLSYGISPKYSFYFEDDPLYQEGKWRTYYPLEDTPDLFLKFARLYDGGGGRYVSSTLITSILGWVHRFGLLGYDDNLYDGGPEESIGNYAGSVYWAAGILTMYEAVLNGDEEAAKSAVLGEFLFVDRLAADFERIGDKASADYKMKSVEKHDNGDYLKFALSTAMDLVLLIVRTECLPTFFPLEGVRHPSEITGGWAFKSLYGATFLQMYWLMAAGGDVARCEFCNRIMSLARPYPEGRKRRRDRRFCDDACRQAHHRSKKRSQNAPS